MVTDLNSVVNEIKDRLVPAGIDRLILFGSYAGGHPNADSDIDLLVVTADDFIPESFSEKVKLDISVSRLIDRIRVREPVDLIVHTRAMHRKFVEKNSLFAQEIANKGQVLYERG